MLNIAEALKTIYKNDMFPLSETIAEKDIKISFPGMDPIYTDRILDDGFSLDESIITDDDIRFGACRASQIKFTLANVLEELKGKVFTIDQLIAGYMVPLGKYKVDSAKLQDDLIFKDVVAYDKLKDIDVDVAAWYNGLAFPITLAAFRASLLAYLGIEAEIQTLPNDDMIVTKTIDPTQISGRVVLEATVELNGAFGHINRSGKFTRIVLKPAYGDYPINDYPQDDYPRSETDTSYVMPGTIDETISQSMYREGGPKYEEYTVKEMDKLQIRSEENDIGAIVGTGSNTYVIEGNFLVFGKNAAELEQIARNAFGNIAKRPYKPFQADIIGLPYIEPGDMISIGTDSPIVGYMLNRTLTGIQALRDEIEAPGSERREQNFGVNKELIQTQGRLARIKKNVEGVGVEIENLAQSTQAGFEITDEKISLEATRAINAENTLAGSISVIAGQVELKVDAGGVVQAINLSQEGAKINVTKLDINGIVTANGRFKINLDGSMEAVNGKFSGNITGATISGSTFVTVGSQYTTSISNGYIDTGFIDADAATILGLAVTQSLYVGANISMSAATGNMAASGGTFTNLTVTNISGGTGPGGFPIHSGNIAYQNVNYAESAGFASEAQTLLSTLYTNQIYASNTGYGNIDFLGFDNAAGVNWVQANFAPIGTSDVRLKHNILPLDNIPDELFYELKPYQFKYKIDSYGAGIHFGLIAQQVESAFQRYGINPYDYNLIETKDVRAYTDDGFYVNEKTHRLHYNNFIAWLIKIVQKQNNRILQLENIIVQ